MITAEFIAESQRALTANDLRVGVLNFHACNRVHRHVGIHPLDSASAKESSRPFWEPLFALVRRTDLMSASEAADSLNVASPSGPFTIGHEGPQLSFPHTVSESAGLCSVTTQSYFTYMSVPFSVTGVNLIL